jgi:hypothetical protein
MSYDLMVFEPASAPEERNEFLTWYKKLTQWNEEHSYNDPAVSSPALKAWFTDMIQTFPTMNGPLAPDADPDDEALLTDYSVGREAIYAAFAWSKAEQAYQTMFDLAARHRVGFFNVSSQGLEIWWPDTDGKLRQT